MTSNALAYSKFILSGEHFVVDGTPGIVIPVYCFSTRITLDEKRTSGISVTCQFDCDTLAHPDDIKPYEDLVRELVIRAADILQIDLTGCGLAVRVRSSIPPGQGAGSSSALCQAIVDVMIKHFFADEFHTNYLQWFGTELENRWHGPVSGIDNAAIARRRIIRYQRNKEPKELAFPCPSYFVIASTGLRGELNPYDVFHKLRCDEPILYTQYRRAMAENTDALESAIVRGDLLGVGECLNDSHALFERIGIVTAPMREAIRVARELGAYGARMTGAGGGGFVIACMPIHRTDALVMKWRKLGLKSIRNIQYGLGTLP